MPAVASVGAAFCSLGINLDSNDDRWGPILSRAGVWSRNKIVVPGYGAATKENSLPEIQTLGLSAGCFVAEESS